MRYSYYYGARTEVPIWSIYWHEGSAVQRKYPDEGIVARVAHACKDHPTSISIESGAPI